jgi:hypothetical protein
MREPFKDLLQSVSHYYLMFRIPSSDYVEERYQYLLKQTKLFIDLLYFYVGLGLVIFSAIALIGACVVAYLLYLRTKNTADNFEEQESYFYDEIVGAYYADRGSYTQDLQSPQPAEHDQIINYHACLEILGLPAGATLSAIKQAYRALARQFHPDTRQSGEAFQDEKFQVVRRAYDTLMELEKEFSLVTQRAK